MGTQTNRYGELVHKVQHRLRLAAVLERGAGLAILLCVFLAVSLILHRFFGWGLDWSVSAKSILIVLASVPVLAILLAWASTRRPDEATAARHLDASCRTKDLFLTRALIGPACGEYKPIVQRQCEQRAASIDPHRVVPIEIGPRTLYAAGGLMILFLGTFLPHLDLLGHGANQQLSSQRKQALAEQKKLAVAKAKVLRKRGVQKKHSKPMQSTLKELQKSLGKMRPNQPRRNAKELNQQKRSLGAKWRRAKSGAGVKSGWGSDSQRLGSIGKSKSNQWARDLRRGNGKSLQKEMREIQDLLDKLAKSKSELEKQKLLSDLADRLHDLKDFAAKETGSKGLNEALSQMLQQLQIAQLEGLSPEALAAMKSGLELSELEMEQLAQQMRDIKALEKALEALQLADALNELDALELDPDALAEAETMDPEELARLLKQMLGQKMAKMAKCGDCKGAGGG